MFVASRETMAGIAGFDVHRGALASACRLPLRPMEAVTGTARLVAVIEDVNDLENLGALFRNAAAFAVDGVLLSPRCADPLYRRCVRVSVGQVLHVPWTRVAGWPSALDALRADGFDLVALTPDRSATPLSSAHGPTAGRRALLVGAEGAGLSPGAMAAASRRVCIPMAPGVDSLNVATAAALAFYQCAARREHCMGGDLRSGPIGRGPSIVGIPCRGRRSGLPPMRSPSIVSMMTTMGLLQPLACDDGSTSS